ncbi:hypothetical protein LguiA_020984 [Lonicera macranthoides]
MPSLLDLSGRARAMWLTCIASAVRTALACTIVGVTTLYSPQALRQHITFPAFSYVTVILIVTDASLGDTLRGSWHALYATVQGVSPSIMSLWLIGPARLTIATTAAAVAVSAFMVVALEKTHLVAKRIALGQIVIIYVIAFVKGAKCDAVMHPVHVAASTALGALACVVALLFPYPNLACYEVKENCKLYGENVKMRLKVLVKAFCAEEKNTSSLALVSQANSLSVKGTKLLQTIKSKQESMQWERHPLKFLKPYCPNPQEKLQELEAPLRGMQIALSIPHSFPFTSLQQELKDHLHALHDHLNLTLDHVNLSMPFDLTVPQSNTEITIAPLETLEAIPQTHKELPSFFFLFCSKLLHNKLISTSSGEDHHSNPKEPTNSSCNPSHRFFRFIPALKCSLSLGLALLFGLKYSKENGFWAGLPVAISLVTSREATFKVANAKAQGTVLGTVYGVLGCFLFEKYVPIRFISLLPLFVFTSFLRRSRMYGQAGGVSAVIGGVLILGRKNFGPPSEFAIARIMETFIGISSSIMVDLLFKPTRASTLVKAQLSRSLHLFHECVGLVSFGNSNKGNLEKSIKGLKAHENELRKLIGEAEVEPNFWILPFNSGCYSKLLGSLSKMVDLLLFEAHAIGFVKQELQKIEGVIRMEIVNKLDEETEVFKEIVGSSMKCFGEVAMIKSLTRLEKELQKNNITYDVELAKPPILLRMGSSNFDHGDEIEKMTSSFLEKSMEVLDTIVSGDNEEKVVKSQVVFGLSALGFCMSSLVRELREIEKGIKELLQWENPSSNVNLYEILCSHKLAFSSKDQSDNVLHQSHKLQSERFHDDVTSDNLYGATHVHLYDGESSFSMLGHVSSLITYSGPIPFSGSISLRSDSSTTSTLSLAFPL